jgi:hypothetical protein
MIDFDRLIFIVIAGGLPWPVRRKQPVDFSTSYQSKPMHFSISNDMRAFDR